ncbi:hypothetical protein F53441_6091 [Fusarium austroafricanum]|uniref:Uncharacterized protein n=1 Tax=Fusarium austroafricanum TaxID=2364996 RepID=A0A8H4KKI3_9HYPO|nr:hypothetical protein F53441_6091 [Fusarium austroafricanum]
MTSQESGQNNNVQEETFKEQLDKAADNTRELENQKPNPIVEKSVFYHAWAFQQVMRTNLRSVTEYVPAAAKILPSQSPPKEEERPPGPPERPHHDDQIEDFVRDQHRSQGVDSILGESPNDE